MVGADTPKHYVECARVYIDERQRKNLIIECQLCKLEYQHWKGFAVHMQMQHSNFTKAPTHTGDSCASLDGLSKGSILADIGQKSVTHANGMATEMVVITEELEESGNVEELDTEINSAEYTLETLVDFKVELVDTGQMDTETLNTESEEEHGTEIVNGNFAISKHTKHHNQSASAHTLSTGRCFFHLRHTDPYIILTFIDVMHKHPCQWNNKHPDYALKDKRDESAVKICKELKDILNIVISPQLARSSVLYLCRWFEREHLRALQRHNKKQKQPKTGRWSRSGYVCAHPDYYRKLLEFLPHDHLRSLFCTTCRRTFKTTEQWLVHQHQMHGGETPYKCHYCKRSFLYRSSLRHHENRHTKENLWHCKLCDYTSAAKTDFHLHMVAHTDIRAYVCELCGAAYKSSTSLKVHMRTHEPPRLECSHCGKKFYENYRLKRHMWIHKAETSAEGAGDAAELDAAELSDSVNDYEEVRQMNTAECRSITGKTEQQFADLSENKTHEFSCTLCELNYYNLDDLRSHALSTHDIIIL